MNITNDYLRSSHSSFTANPCFNGGFNDAERQVMEATTMAGQDFGEASAALALMEQCEWEPVTGAKLIGFAVGVALLLLLIFRSEPGFVFLLDHANLLFHEAGHPLVGLFSSRLETYGGTIGQLVFPCVLAVSFWRKGQALGLAAACIWFFENWFNIARYVADARTLELPLVGGGDHDWNTILTRWDLLQYDTRIAAALRLIGWIGMGVTCAWVSWRAWQDRGRADGTALR